MDSSMRACSHIITYFACVYVTVYLIFACVAICILYISIVCMPACSFTKHAALPNNGAK